MTYLVLLLALALVGWFTATYRTLHDDRGTPPRSHHDDPFAPRRELY